MHDPRWSLLLSLVLLCPGPRPAVAQVPDSTALDRGRTLTHAFYAGDLTTVIEAFDPRALSAIGGSAALETFREQVLERLGEESRVLDETVRRDARQTIYRRSARFGDVATPVLVLWSFGAEGRVVAFQIQPDQTHQEPAPSPHSERSTRTELRLPFQGQWTVFWGGRTVEDNYHVASVDQRFAYDFVVTVDGTRHQSHGDRNEDYFCFRRPVVAPAPGTVVAVEGDVEDNQPGVMNPREAPGNHVVLDHGNGEYSVLAHLSRGSVKVTAGEVVERGDLLGLCGNSGNSSEPHLHYHLQDTGELGIATGLPAQFKDYLADGEHVVVGEPIRGQKIRPAGRRHRQADGPEYIGSQEESGPRTSGGRLTGPIGKS